MSIEQVIASISKQSAEQRSRMRRHAIEQLESKDAKQREDAQRLLSQLDEQETEEQAVLIDEMTGLNRAQRVVRAFTDQPMTDTEAKLIQVLLDNPASTSTELTEKIGWKGQSWHLHFGTMCADRAIFLWPAPSASWRNGKFFSGILADFDENSSRFTMKPDVEEGFAQLGIQRRIV